MSAWLIFDARFPFPFQTSNNLIVFWNWIIRNKFIRRTLQKMLLTREEFVSNVINRSTLIISPLRFSIWNEQFIFECDEQSNQFRLQLYDRRLPSKKSKQQVCTLLDVWPIEFPQLIFMFLLLVDRMLIDLFIPFVYCTSRYKQDIRLAPQYPNSTIRIEVCNN